MGHSDIKLTANIYTNLNNDDISDIADLLSKVSADFPHQKVAKSNKMYSEVQS